MWEAHGRIWAHLVSDESLDELHAFAAAQGIPRKGFHGDHYDVPAEYHAQMVEAGAVPTPAREVVRLLRAAGLRLTPDQRRMRQDGNSTVESVVTAPVIMTGAARSPLKLAHSTWLDHSHTSLT